MNLLYTERPVREERPNTVLWDRGGHAWLLFSQVARSFNQNIF